MFNSNKDANLKNMDLNGDTNLEPYTVDAPLWIADESQFAVDDITGDMIQVNQIRYANKSNYYLGKYSSASGKAISLVREWYVDQVIYQVWDYLFFNIFYRYKQVWKPFIDDYL